MRTVLFFLVLLGGWGQVAVTDPLPDIVDSQSLESLRIEIVRLEAQVRRGYQALPQNGVQLWETVNPGAPLPDRAYAPFLADYDRLLVLRIHYLVSRARIEAAAAYDSLDAPARRRLQPFHEALETEYLKYRDLANRGLPISDQQNGVLDSVVEVFHRLDEASQAFGAERVPSSRWARWWGHLRTIGEFAIRLWESNAEIVDLVAKFAGRGNVASPMARAYPNLARDLWHMNPGILGAENLPKAEVRDGKKVYMVETAKGREEADAVVLLADHHYGPFDAGRIAELTDRMGAGNVTIITSLQFTRRLPNTWLRSFMLKRLEQNPLFLAVLGQSKDAASRKSDLAQLIERVRDRLEGGRGIFFLMPQGNVGAGLGESQRAPADSASVIPTILNREGLRVALIPVSFAAHEHFGATTDVQTEQMTPHLPIRIGKAMSPDVLKALLKARQNRSVLDVYWRMWSLESATPVFPRGLAGSPTWEQLDHTLQSRFLSPLGCPEVYRETGRAETPDLAPAP